MKRILIVLVFLIAIGGALYLPYANPQSQTVLVVDKERVYDSSGGSSYYLIFTDVSTYKVVDQPMLFIFDASDIYGTIHRDSTYVIETHGFRIPFLSMYQRIETVTPAIFKKNK